MLDIFSCVSHFLRRLNDVAGAWITRIFRFLTPSLRNAYEASDDDCESKDITTEIVSRKK